jgi:hypothetical protein
MAMANFAIMSALKAYGSDLPREDGPVRRFARGGAAKIAKAWDHMPNSERLWYKHSQVAHSIPGVLLVEVVSRHGPGWWEVFEGVAAIAGAAAAASGKNYELRSPAYIADGPKDLSSRIALLRQ